MNRITTPTITAALTPVIIVVISSGARVLPVVVPGVVLGVVPEVVPAV